MENSFEVGTIFVAKKPKRRGAAGTSRAVPKVAESGRQFIREWRLHRQMTVKELGDKAGLSGSMVAQLERGSSGYTKRSLEAIAAALDVPPWQLLAFPPEDAQEVGIPTVREVAELWDGIPDKLKPMARKIIQGQAENLRALIKLIMVARDDDDEHKAA